MAQAETIITAIRRLARAQVRVVFICGKRGGMTMPRPTNRVLGARPAATFDLAAGRT
jgi:hypothetical protein